MCESYLRADKFNTSGSDKKVKVLFSLIFVILKDMQLYKNPKIGHTI